MVSTINPEEAAHFGRLAADWWNPAGESAMLHRLNPARLAYVRERIDAHFQTAARDRHPLAGRTALDVGCGAGLLAEPLARLGASVTGVDAAPENIAAARIHAAEMGLEISYRDGEAAQLAAEERRFDLVTSMEVIEHVTDVPAFLSTLAALVKPDGLVILSTPNRTQKSRLAMITLGEGLKLIPRGTHDWSSFLTPDELEQHLSGAGLRVIDFRGLSFSPSRGFVLSDDLTLNYLVTATPGH
jgi:2-polyprenyl-6-hydroxyphenyl methylase/3-demethylubiquinone-9 3-methyltransferase